MPGDRFIELATAEDRRVLDVLFANEAEILALHQVGSIEEALPRLRARRGISFVTRGADGSLVVEGDLRVLEQL